MLETPPFLPETILRNYFHSKDENRPHLLNSVFDPEAILEVRNSSSVITFPAVTTGREGIADVLVRNFGQSNENVYSFYLSRPTGPVSHFSCDWMVVMTEKSSRNLRVGCGSYDWLFSPAPPGLAQHLVITINDMRVLSADHSDTVFAWLSRLTYPWSTPDQILSSAPSIDELSLVMQHLRQS